MILYRGPKSSYIRYVMFFSALNDLLSPENQLTEGEISALARSLAELEEEREHYEKVGGTD